MKWYFVRCQSGREDSIARSAPSRLKVAGLSDVVPQVLVPFEREPGRDVEGCEPRAPVLAQCLAARRIAALLAQDVPLLDQKWRCKSD